MSAGLFWCPKNCNHRSLCCEWTGLASHGFYPGCLTHLRHCDHSLLPFSSPLLLSHSRLHILFFLTLFFFDPLTSSDFPLVLNVFLKPLSSPFLLVSVSAPILFISSSIALLVYSLPSSPRYISFLAPLSQPRHLMGLIPFLTVCLQLWGRYWLASLCFSHHLLPLSLTSLSISPCSCTDGSSPSLILSLKHLLSHFTFSVFLNFCITLSLCVFCISSICWCLFHYTSSFHQFSPLLILPFFPPLFSSSLLPILNLSSWLTWFILPVELHLYSLQLLHSICSSVCWCVCVGGSCCSKIGSNEDLWIVWSRRKHRGGKRGSWTETCEHKKKVKRRRKVRCKEERDEGETRQKIQKERGRASVVSPHCFFPLDLQPKSHFLSPTVSFTSAVSPSLHPSLVPPQ